MTEKQMIIDGVDMSGCEWYSSTYFKPCDGCRNTPNCYYKQLKRKEQECERLKGYLKEIRNEELKNLDIEWEEYETQYIDTEYSNIITLVEEALEEIIPEDCRYGK